MRKYILFCFLITELFFSLTAERFDSLSLEGTWSFNFYGRNSCSVYGERVVNRSRYSRSFILSFFLSKCPYSGGSIIGYEAGRKYYNYLSADYQYSDIIFAADNFRYEEPPSGVYYPVILVIDEKNGIYGVVDFITFRNTLYYRNSGYSYARRSHEIYYRAYDSIRDDEVYDGTSDAIIQITEGVVDIIDSIIQLTSPKPPPSPPNRRPDPYLPVPRKPPRR